MINLRNIFVKTNIVLVFCLIWNHSSLAQSLFDTTYIDTIALKVKRDFDAQDFIRMTKEDTSFHRAFKNLKMYPHQSKNSVTIFNKTWDQIAQLKRTATHLSDGKLGSIQIDNETTDGKFYKKNGEHKYFTGEMFDKVFEQTSEIAEIEMKPKMMGKKLIAQLMPVRAKKDSKEYSL